MDDLISRLRQHAAHCNSSAAPLRRALIEAAATLEAAREDAERYRWLRQMIYDERIITAQDNQAAMLCGDKLDAAIDAAREARNG